MEVEEQKYTVFTLIDSIVNKTGNMFEVYPEQSEQLYTPFVVNRHFSLCSDTIFIANEVNKYSSFMSNKQQYDLYYNLVPKKKRFVDYNKYKKKDAINIDINILQWYFDCSIKKAVEYRDVLSNEQLQEIQKIYERNMT